MHSCSGISCLGRCLDDLVKLSHRFRVFSGQLFGGLFILAALLEGYEHLIFNHVRSRIVDITEPSNEILKRLIGSLDACEQIILLTGIGVCCMEVGLEHLA